MTYAGIIIQNNLAVAHLRANHHDVSYAILLCTFALERAAQGEHLSSSTGGTDGAHSNSSIDQHMFILDPDEQATDSVNDDDTSTFLYKAGIVIPTSETDPNIITPIILFNTALAHHLLADQDSVHSFRHLQNAKALYELAFISQDAAADTNFLFEFAILNNVAMIYRTFGDEPTANQYIDYLLSAYMLFVVRDYSVHLRQVRGFLLNLSARTKPVAVAA